MLTVNTTLIEIVRKFFICALAGVLAVFGYIHFRDGIANDVAIPVPIYMISYQQIPKAAFVDAAFALANADPRDGIAVLLGAEASMRAGHRSQQIVEELKVGLAGAPASARGWTLLSEALYPTDKKSAARALAQALILAPRDYWLVGPQALDAARLWSDLDPDTQRAAQAKARLLWSDTSLHGHLRTVVDTPEGAKLMTRALSGDEIRNLNRWLSRERHRDS